MLDSLLQIVAPHHCYGCGKTGLPLCYNCKYDIISDSFFGCIVCRRPTLSDNLCPSCRGDYVKAWCCGDRSEVLKRLIDAYKFERVRLAAAALVEVIDGVLPDLPSDTVVVPVPTVAAHIRQRGYDHAALVARGVARKRHLRYRALIDRLSTDQQHGRSRAIRIAQAKSAFAVRPHLAENRPYLLVDDVMTTGATLQYAAKSLRTAGARQVWVAVVARQPLDNHS